MAEKINTKPFILHSDFKPSGDQPQAISFLISFHTKNLRQSAKVARKQGSPYPLVMP